MIKVAVETLDFVTSILHFLQNFSLGIIPIKGTTNMYDLARVSEEKCLKMDKNRRQLRLN